MRRIVLLTLCVLYVLTSLCQTIEINNIKYAVISQNEAEVKDGTKAFGDIKIPDRIWIEGKYYYVTSIAASAFFEIGTANIELKSIVLPNTIKTIGENAFWCCRGLVSIIIPEGITKIGAGAFYSCTSLKSIVIPNSVMYIGDYILGNCDNLESIILPDNIEEIFKSNSRVYSDSHKVMIVYSTPKLRYN